MSLHRSRWTFATSSRSARLETLHYRYITCLSPMRVSPPKHGSVELNNLELYEKTMSTGLPLQAPAMRN